MRQQITVQESQKLFQCPPNQVILCYTTQFKNNTIIYCSHLEINGNQIKHDRNGYAYETIFTANAIYVLILVQKPSSIQLLDLRTGDVQVIRGLDDLINYRVLAVTTQNQQGLKPNQQARRIYLILEQKGSYLLRMVQISSKIEVNPNIRQRMLQQVNSSASLIYRMNPTFSLCRWNFFLLIRKGAMRICKPAIKNDNIEIDFQVQIFQSKMAQIFSSNQILGMAENNKTWAILRGNGLSSRNDSNIQLFVFWQHYFALQINQNMYFRDQSFIKSVILPCTQRQYVRIWQIEGFYLVQTKGKQINSHFCYIISEQIETDLVAVRIGYNSSICSYSLMLSPTQLSICQIADGKQINKLRITEKLQKNMTSQTRTGHTSTINQTNSASLERKAEREGNNERIKKFEPVEEERRNKIVIQDNENKNENEGKSTTKKVLSEKNKIQQTKSLINSQLVDHFTKLESQNKKVDDKSDENDLQVPSSLEPVISFGQAGNIGTKIPAANTALISFGGQKKVQVTQDIPKPKQLEKVQQKSITVEQAKHIRQQFMELNKKLSRQLADRVESFNENYRQLSLKQLFTVERILYNPELKKLFDFEKIITSIEVSCKRINWRERKAKQKKQERLKQLGQKSNRFEKMLGVLKINSFGEMNLNLGVIKKKGKSLNEELVDSMRNRERRVQQLQRRSKQLWCEAEERYEKQVQKCQPLRSTAQIIRLVQGKRKGKVQHCLRIPIQRIICLQKLEPFLHISPQP